jgi:hypothetical protein
MSWLPDWITGYDAANAQAAAEADAQLQAMNAQDYAPGGRLYTPQNAAKVQADYASQAPIGVDAQRASIDQAFADGFSQGYQNVKNTFSDFASKLFGLIPWQVWLVGLGVLFVWMGGMVWLKGILKKHA